MSEAEETQRLPIVTEDVRVLDAVPAREAVHTRASVAGIPVVQAAAVAAGGFVAGAAVVGLTGRRRSRALAKGRPRRALGRRGRVSATGGGRTGGELLQIVGSRSLLLDVHLLGGSGAER
jgi:hypothetical protein